MVFTNRSRARKFIRSSRGLTLAGACAVAGAAGWMGWATPELSATSSSGVDLDGDGLPDLAEAGVGSSPFAGDTDFDLYSDTEEVARGSNPSLDTDTPVPGEQALALASYADAGMVYFCSIMYVAAGTPQPRFNLGLVVGGTPVPLAPSTYLSLSTYDVMAGKEAGDGVHVLRTALPVALLANFSSLSLYSMIEQAPGSGSSAPPVAVAATYLMNGDVPVLVRQAPGNISPGSGLIYEPLSADTELVDWTPGKICYTSGETVGLIGSSVVWETTSANCEPFDTRCLPSACANNAGQLIELPDPAFIAGGG
ncbi:MAG: hypothetical protein WD226_01600 [Planctomycetota bacterium]